MGEIRADNTVSNRKKCPTADQVLAVQWPTDRCVLKSSLQSAVYHASKSLWVGIYCPKNACYNDISMKMIDLRTREENRSRKNSHFSELHNSFTITPNPIKKYSDRKSNPRGRIWYANERGHFRF